MFNAKPAGNRASELAAAVRFAAYDEALAEANLVSRPVGLLDLEHFEANAKDLVQRAAGKPIRVASKSLRIRRALEHTLGKPGFAGVLAFTLPEAIWLAESGIRRRGGGISVRGCLGASGPGGQRRGARGRHAHGRRHRTDRPAGTGGTRPPAGPGRHRHGCLLQAGPRRHHRRRPLPLAQRRGCHETRRPDSCGARTSGWSGSWPTRAR